MSEPNKPFDTDDVLDAHLRLQNTSSLRDLGIGQLTWWRMAATCGRHGRLSRYEETTGGPPPYTTVTCHSCKKDGLTRPCLIDQLEVVVGEKPPVLDVPEENK